MLSRENREWTLMLISFCRNESLVPEPVRGDLKDLATLAAAVVISN